MNVWKKNRWRNCRSILGLLDNNCWDIYYLVSNSIELNIILNSAAVSVTNLRIIMFVFQSQDHSKMRHVCTVLVICYIGLLGLVKYSDACK